jgi:hypothetical protein
VTKEKRMTPDSLPAAVRTRPLRGFAGRLRESTSPEERRARREHDDAMTDRRIAIEHRLQVNRSVELGRGGCRFCD